MQRKKRKIKFLLLSFLSLAGMAAIFFLVPPNTKLSLVILSIPIPLIFLLLLLVFSFSCITFLFRSYKHSVLFSLFILSYLLLRIFGFSHPLFFFLLLGIFLTLEMVFTSKAS